MSSLPAHATQAEILPSSVNADQRTVDVVWSTGQRIQFHDWELGDYLLTLGLDPENVRLDFARQGAPVLDNHRGYMGTEAVKGVIDRIDVDGKRGTATLRFSKRPDVDPIWQDVQDGVLRFVSVGTRLHKLEDLTEEDDKIKHYRAIDHEPLEISLANIPRDRGAVMQSEGDEKPERFPVEIVQQSARAAHKGESKAMDPEITKQKENPVPGRAELAERKRIVEIRKVAKHAGLGDDWTDGQIESGATVDQARESALANLADRDDSLGIRPHFSVQGPSSGASFVESAEDALHARITGGTPETPEGKRFADADLADIARECLIRQSDQRVGFMRRSKLIEQALHSTSDFPLILGNLADRSLRTAYEIARAGVMTLSMMISARDFREIQRLMLGEAPTLEMVRESGEFTRGTIDEEGASFQLATYGRIVGLTRQALVNDDLSAFSQIVPQMGGMAAELENQRAAALLISNPTMSDGNAVFSSAHGNLADTPSAISVDSLGEARKAMRKQTGVDGQTLVNIVPTDLVVPAALETTAEKVLAEVTAATVDDVNPFSNRLGLVVDPRLDADSETRWYLAAKRSAGLEHAYLEGNQGPYIQTREGFDVDGVEFKVRLDFGIGFVDWRSWYRNDGA